MSDMTVEVDQSLGWEHRPSVTRDSDVSPGQANVRWFINVLNQVLSENYILRQELEQRRSGSDDVGLYEITVAAPPTSYESPGDWLEKSDSRRLFKTLGGQRTEAARFQEPSGDDELESMNQRSIRSDMRMVTWEEHEKVVHQLEALGQEFQSLKSEFRARIRIAQPEQSSPVDSTQPESLPRFQPIRMSRQDLTFEADPHPGMWMKLRQPWFYLPLFWATLVANLGFDSRDYLPLAVRRRRAALTQHPCSKVSGRKPDKIVTDRFSSSSTREVENQGDSEEDEGEAGFIGSAAANCLGELG